MMILVMAAQVVVIEGQQRWGPRWFVPERFRRNPFAFNYYQDVPQSLINRDKKQRAKAQGASGLLTGEELKDDADDGEAEMLCVICMNAIHLDVDESGCLSQGGQRGVSTQSCSNPFQGCLESIRHYNEVRRARIQLAARQ